MGNLLNRFTEIDTVYFIVNYNNVLTQKRDKEIIAEKLDYYKIKYNRITSYKINKCDAYLTIDFFIEKNDVLIHNNCLYISIGDIFTIDGFTMGYSDVLYVDSYGNHKKSSYIKANTRADSFEKCLKKLNFC